jgi:nucleoid DNA-binding protein
MTEKTTFSELIDKISGRVGKDHGFTQEFMRELVSIIESGLKENGSVSISGFGKFEARWMDERKGTHPKTGEEITIPAQNKIVFKPYKALREHVNLPFARMEPHLLGDLPEETEKGKAPPNATKEEQAKNLLEEQDESPEIEKNKETGLETGNTKPKSAEHTPDEGPDDYEAAPFPFFMEEEDSKIPGDEDQEELIVERESPEPFEPTQKTPVEAEPEKDDKLDINFEETAAPVYKSEKDSTFNWTYVAAAMVILLVILALYYLMSRQPEVTEPVAEPPRVEAEPPPVIEESTPNDIEETELIAIIIDAGQSLWNLAMNYLGDPYLWPWIYHLNSETIDDPNQIFTGSDLTIPVPADPDDLSDNDRREVATGYVDVYQWYREQGNEEARFYLWAAGEYDISIFDEIEDRVDPDDLSFARNR